MWSVELGGAGEDAVRRFSEVGMISLRRSPTFIPVTPSSSPAMTCPAPSLNVMGVPFSYVLNTTTPFTSLTIS